MAEPRKGCTCCSVLLLWNNSPAAETQEPRTASVKANARTHARACTTPDSSVPSQEQLLCSVKAATVFLAWPHALLSARVPEEKEGLRSSSRRWTCLELVSSELYLMASYLFVFSNHQALGLPVLSIRHLRNFYEPEREEREHGGKDLSGERGTQKKRHKRRKGEACI